MARPLIGLMPLVDERRHSLWMIPGYLQGVEAAGGLPVMLPLTTTRETLSALADTLDGLLLTGGHDICPQLYGEAPIPACGPVYPDRDRMEYRLLWEMLRRDKAVFGICRGIQFLASALGGTLYQDLPTQHPSPVEHHQSPPYDRPVHRVDLLPDTPLRALLGREALEVNSYHHQGVRTPGPHLLEMARSEDGLCEGVWMPGRRFVWAVQWHPELVSLEDTAAQKLFGAFVEAASRRNVQ